MLQLPALSMVKGREKVEAGNESGSIWRNSLKSVYKKAFLLSPNLYTAASSKAPLNINLLKSLFGHFKPREHMTFPCVIGSEVTLCNKIISTKSSTYIWFSYWGCWVTFPWEQGTKIFPIQTKHWGDTWGMIPSMSRLVSQWKFWGFLQ